MALIQKDEKDGVQLLSILSQSNNESENYKALSSSSSC